MPERCIEEDFILDVDITPNRADALSHCGVARDLAAYYQYHGKDIQVKLPNTEILEKTADLPFVINIEDKEACTRYSGLTIKGVQVADSPDWLQSKLNSIGLSPIIMLLMLLIL